MNPIDPSSSISEEPRTRAGLYPAPQWRAVDGAPSLVFPMLRVHFGAMLCGLMCLLLSPAASAAAIEGCGPTIEQTTVNGIDWRTLLWGKGKGEPVLLLHGFPQDADVWRSVGAQLAEQGYRVIAFDQRGSSPETLSGSPSDYNFRIFVADALAIADAHGARRFHVIGFGWGGAMAWMLAATYPDRVISMTTLRYPHPAAFVAGMASDPDQRASWEEVRKQIDPQNIERRAQELLANDAAGLRAFLGKSGLPAPYIDSYVARLSKPGVLLGGLSWGTALVPDEFAVVPPVTIPVLYLWSKGPAVSESTVVASSQYAKGRYEVIEIPGIGHFMLETDANAVIGPIRNFLSSLPAERHK